MCNVTIIAQGDWTHEIKVTCAAVGEVAEPDIAVTLEVKHASTVVAADNCQVSIAHCPRVLDHRQIGTANRCNRTTTSSSSSHRERNCVHRTVQYVLH